MRILQIVPELRSGGVERGTVDFAKHLLREGHHSVIVSAGGPLVDDLKSAGVTHYTLAVHRKSLWAILRAVKALVQILANEKIEVVHARSRVPAWIAYFACRKAKIPLVTTCHGIYNTSWMSRVMGWGKKVIAISHAVSIHMKEKFDVAHDRIALIHRGVNLKDFIARGPIQPPHAQGRFTVGIVGRITPIKGHSVLIKAMARVIRAMGQVRLVVVGDAPKVRYREELEALARRLGIRDRVEFLGTRYDVPDLIRKMDLLVAPAVGEEAFGRVVIEAGASGVPVIASRIGGMVDIFEDGKEGLFVPAGDPAALAEAILKLLKDTGLANRLAANLRKKVESQFSDQEMFRKTLEVYRQVIEETKVLVIKLSALGDVILSVPSLREIRRHMPKAKITLACDRKSISVLKTCPYIDDWVALEPQGRWGRWFYLMRLGHWMRKEYYEVCFDFQNNRMSHWLSFVSGAYRRIGYNNRKMAWLLTDRVKDTDLPLSPAEHQFRLLEYLGWSDLSPQLELWVDPEAEKSVESFLNSFWLGKGQLLVGINPGSSPLWPTKRWPLERFAKLCDELSKRNIRVVLMGTAEEAPLIKPLLALTQSKPISAVGKTALNELVALISRVDALVTSDSAPMHIASSLGVPFVALFGPTDPVRHVQTQGPHAVHFKKVACSPCYRRTCHVGHICMKEIEPDEVLGNVLGLLQQTQTGVSSASEIAPMDAASPTGI